MTTLKDILSTNENAKLIKDRDFDNLYKNVPIEFRTLLTSTFYAVGEDPLKHLTKSIPSYFAQGPNPDCENIPANIIFPGTIKITEYNSFSSNKFISRVAMPGVETVGNSSFSFCSNLQSVVFGEGLYKIGAAAFIGCYSLSELYLPASVEIIEERAFESCFGIRNVYYAGTMEDWTFNRVYSTAFKYCNVTTVKCSDGVTDIYI